MPDFDRVPFKPDAEPDLARNAVSINRMEGMSYLDYSSYHRMCDFLRISDADRREPKIAEKVGYIADWAQSLSGSKREIDHMKEIKRVIGQMGESHVGIDLLDRLHRYTRLDEDKKGIEEEMGLYTQDSGEKIDSPIKIPSTDRIGGERMKERLAAKIEKELRTKVKREVNKEHKIKEAQRLEEESQREETGQFIKNVNQYG